ncbi:MAG: hypothetical protein FJ284_14515 [Planctomycetes bacterium]|nr:hypothetical protein [Planctomycetota bacterium]
MTADRLLLGGPAVAGPAGLDGGTPAGYGRVIGAALGMAIACGGATLLTRRLVGGFAVVPGPAVAWGVTLAGGTLVLATELAARLGGERRPGLLARGGLIAAALAFAPIDAEQGWARGLGTAAAMVLAIIWAVAVPPRSPGLRWAARRGRRLLTRRPAPRRTAAAHTDPPRPEPMAPEPRPDLSWGEPVAAGMRQRLERFETAAGDDCLRGRLLVPIAAGSRAGHAHVGFCPPFTITPSVEASTDGDFVETTVTAAEILPWGVRIECRLSEQAEEPLEIPVVILAHRPA